MDDQAITPQAPQMEPEQAEEQAIDEAVVEEKKLASAYFHPAWDKVQDIINEELAALALFPSANLLAEEYKIEAVTRAKASLIIINLVDRIKHAVESVERTARKPRGE